MAILPKELPTELNSALDRPLDRASIDRRMQDHLQWEGAARTAPRAVETVEQEAQRVPNASGSRIKPKRLLAVGATVLGLATAAYLTGEAIDHELDTGKPHFPQPSGQEYNTGVDGNGNVVRIYSGTP